MRITATIGMGLRATPRAEGSALAMACVRAEASMGEFYCTGSPVGATPGCLRSVAQEPTNGRGPSWSHREAPVSGSATQSATAGRRSRSHRDSWWSSRWGGTVFLLALAVVGINLLGAIACGVGMLVSYPVTVVAGGYAYRVLSNEPVAPIAP